VEAMTLLQWAFDTVLAVTLMWVAWKALASEDLFKGIALFIAFGLLMALVWVRLEAPDIALAEAAIGAGLTGALLLAALAKLESGSKDSQPLQVAMLVKATTNTVNKQILFRWLLVLLLSVLVAGLSYVVLSLPLQAIGLSETVMENLEASGVSNPVTAVLLNFRGYDTLLELAVLLLALLGVWSLSNLPEQHESAPSKVLDMLTRLLVPLLILVSGYLLWTGAHAPGGAFQAGSVLAAAGVLLLLAGWRLEARFAGLFLRITLVLGLAMFVTVAIVVQLAGLRLLEFPLSIAGTLILLIEVAATLSIGMTLAALFFGRRPRTDQADAGTNK